MVWTLSLIGTISTVVTPSIPPTFTKSLKSLQVPLNTSANYTFPTISGNPGDKISLIADLGNLSSIASVVPSEGGEYKIVVSPPSTFQLGSYDVMLTLLDKRTASSVQYDFTVTLVSPPPPPPKPVD